MAERDEPLLAEQIAYYRARAPEYDNWSRRAGMYDWGEEFNAAWRVEFEELRGALEVFRPRGKVLELACGTGEWTIRLAADAELVTGIDAAPEALAIARAKVEDSGLENVELLEDDIFYLQPKRRYDVAFFGFWLSHVPEPYLDRFWELIRASLGSRGRFFLVDNAPPAMEVGDIPGVSVERAVITSASGTTDISTSTSERLLEDGRRFKIVKRFFSPEELEADLARRGFVSEFHLTGQYFIYGSGRRAE